MVTIGSVLFALLRLVDPYIYKRITDDILVKPLIEKSAVSADVTLLMAAQSVALACLAIFVVRILTSAIFSFYTYLSLRVYFQIEAKMFAEAQRHLQSLDIGFHQGQNSGELLQRVEKGIAGSTVILHEEISRKLLPGIVNIICLVGWLFWQDYRLALAAIFFLPFHFYFSLKRGGNIPQEQQAINRANEQVFHRAYENINNIEAVVSFNASERELTVFTRERNQILERQLGIAKAWRIINFSASFFEVIGRISIIIVGAWLILKREATLGDIIMFLAYASMLYQPLLEMVVSALTIRQNFSKVERFVSLMGVKTKIIDLPHAIEMPPLRHAIEFKNVSFAYDSQAKALANISLTIPAGKKLAIVGPSGAGKSTLANMIQRYYDPAAGIIAVDGTDLRKLALRSIHRQISIITQHPLLFSRTIKENIIYGRPNANQKEIIEAAQAANAREFIEKLPEEYETIIGEDGVRLSGGEQQRLSIARAVICAPSVIIMDEATAHLDSLSEAAVQEAIGRLMRDKTVIIIAHRLSTVLEADLIVVMDRGRIVDIGSHKELLNRCELYQNLYNRQFKDE